MRNLTTTEREEMRTLIEQLDRAIAHDNANTKKADRRAKDSPVSIDRRCGPDRRAPHSSQNNNHRGQDESINRGN